MFVKKFVFCLFVKVRLRQSGPRRAWDKDIPGYRSLGTIHVASYSRRCTAVPVAAPGGEKLLTQAFYAIGLVLKIGVLKG